MTSQPASEPAAPAPAPAAAAAEVPPAESASPRPAASGRLLPLAVALALGAAAAGTFPLWRAQVGLPAPAGTESFEVENLRAELSAATARLAQLEARPGAAMDNTRLDRLEEAVKAAQGQAGPPAIEIDSISKQVADLKRNSADAAAVLRLAERLEQAEAAIRELQARRASAATLLLAVGQLREAVTAGRPFEAEWRAARVLAGEDGESLGLLDQLKDHAAVGIPTRSALLGRFDVLAPALIRAEILPEGEGWWRRTADRLLSLVTIRREDGAAVGANAAAVVGRAQAAAGRGDLGGALTELGALGAGPAEAAAPWMAEARARQAADRALSQLAAQAVALAGARP